MTARIPGFTDAEHKAYLTGRAMGHDRLRAEILAEIERRARDYRAEANATDVATKAFVGMSYAASAAEKLAEWLKGRYP